MAFDTAGNIYVADLRNHVVRRIDGKGVITTYAGTGQRGAGEEVSGTATSASISFPAAVLVGTDRGVYITENGNFRIIEVRPDGTLSLVAGNGSFGYSGDGGPATKAEFSHPVGLAFDAKGNLYIADREANVIREVCA